MRIRLDPRYREAATSRFAEHDLVFFQRTSKRFEDVIDQIRDSEVLVLGQGFGFIGRDSLEKIPDLRFIQKSGAGVDWFDVDALTDRGILLANNAGVNASSVAEHAIALALLCLHNTFRYLSDMRAGVWDREPPGLNIMRLEGKVVGIVGLGHIGAHIARRVSAFGATVIAYQRHPDPAVTILSGVRWVSFDDLLRESDLVMLCVPLTPETEHLVSARELGLMKHTAVLVNCSRGKVVDERSLYEALSAGRLRGAGLDVFEEEPTPADNPLLRLPNVVATPHLAGGSVEVAPRQVEAAISNVDLYLRGQRPERLINPEVLNGSGGAPQPESA